MFWLLDRGSFEIGGDATGASVFSQTVCTSPVNHLTPETSWTTDCIMAFPNNASSYTNKHITHMFPRWADTQAFDYQYKGTTTLLGVFEKVDLIRSMQRKDAGSPELKVVDKYIFDEALAYTTPAKMIVMRTDPLLLKATPVEAAVHQENVWTWVFDDVEARARAEFGLETPPVEPRVDHDYWTNWTIDKYQEDMLPVGHKDARFCLSLSRCLAVSLSRCLSPPSLCLSLSLCVCPCLSVPLPVISGRITFHRRPCATTLLLRLERHTF